MSRSFGRIELILGPMFSGKSSELFRRLHRHSLARRNCILGKYAKDPWPFNETFKNPKNGVPVEEIMRLKDLDWPKYDIIGIDEG